MTATAPLLRAIKKTLCSRGLTYRRLAEFLSVSEATVKRDLSKAASRSRAWTRSALLWS